jgi:putative flippase GtrA
MQKLGSRYARLFKILIFVISSGIGFVVAEVILTIGVLTIFGRIGVKSVVYSSPELLALDIFALIIGVTISFFINQTSFKWAELIDSAQALLSRLLRFQLISGAGNVLIIVIQLLLLKEFAISPSVGSIVGALATFPLAYLISMRYVWRKSNGKTGNGKRIIKEEK